MIIPKSIPQIRAESPFPWKEMIIGGNRLLMLDATGKEVPMFSITALAEQITEQVAAKKGQNDISSES